MDISVMLIFDMEVSMNVVSHHRIEQLKMARRRARGNERDRIQMVVLAMQGETAPAIATALGVSRRTAQEWVYRYNEQGMDGLRDQRGGNHRHLTTDHENSLRDYIDREADDPEGGVRRAEDVRQWIDQQFGVLYALSGVYELLHRLGYSSLMPRPRHAQTDPKTQAAFKKKPLKKWAKSQRSTRANASKSGCKTKRASVSKAQSAANGRRPDRDRSQ